MIKRLFPILLIIFTNILGAGVIIPILPLYAEGEFGGTVPQVTLLATAFFGAQFLAAPVLGRLSDRYGRRPLLMISQLGTVLAFILFIFAAPIGRAIDAAGLNLPLSGGMVMLYVARLLDGITGGNLTIAQAYVSDLTSAEDRAEGLGLLQAAFGVGFIFGPAFGGLLSGFSSVAPFIGAAVITTGTLMLTTFTLRESLPMEERGESSRAGRSLPSLQVLRDQPSLALILGTEFLLSSAFSALPATFALYADQVLFSGRADASLLIALMLTFLGAMQVLTQLALLRPLVRRLGERRLLLVGQLSLILAFAGVAGTNNPVLTTLLLAPFAFGQGVSEPGLQSLTTRFGSNRERGQLLGYYQSARSLALILGPIWAGLAFDAVSPNAVYAISALLMVIALRFGLLLLKAPLPERSPAPQKQSA
jgi:DHA1 family tetracycline resistance protein-like MFS transporter